VDKYELVAPYTNSVGITVPGGFLTNGASIPRGLWDISGYSPFHPCLIGPCITHDYLYSLYSEGIVTKQMADSIFYEDLISEGIPVEMAYVMYKAVDIFGNKFWKIT
jgi:lysozyme family protein